MANELIPGAIGLLARRIRSIHWAWLVIGVASDWLLNAIPTTLAFVVDVVPVLGPVATWVTELTLGPIVNTAIATIPIVCGYELLRRLDGPADVEEEVEEED